MDPSCCIAVECRSKTLVRNLGCQAPTLRAWRIDTKRHTKRQQVHISMFRNLQQLINSVAIGF
jgi:hypothetical protein